MGNSKVKVDTSVPDLQHRKAMARSRAARNDLDCWTTRFRNGFITIQDEQHAEREISYVKRVVRAMCGNNHLVAAREFDNLATEIRNESSYSRYSSTHCEQIVDGLLQAATYEQDPMVSCPWRECLDKIHLNPRLFALGRSLWTMNRKGLRKWTIDLDTLNREVWGQEETSTSTVRSLVSEFRKHLEAHNVPLTISVHDTRDNRRVRCTLPEDFNFDLSW